MSLRIIFDLFSGRPNPTITLDGNDATAFLNELSALKTGVTATTVSAAQQESKLGYRGLIVEQIGAPQAGLAGRFRITRDHVLSGGTTLSLAKGGFEERLLTNSDRLLDGGEGASRTDNNCVDCIGYRSRSGKAVEMPLLADLRTQLVE